MVLATLESDEADGFVLQQFEALASKRDHARIMATVKAARRLSAQNEPRLVLAILRALDLPVESQSYYMLIHMTEYLSPSGKAAVMAAAETRKPISGPVDVSFTLSSGRRFLAQRNFTGVSRWSMDSLGFNPDIRR